MHSPASSSFIWLGSLIAAGLAAFGLVVSWAALEIRSLERTVTAKGLAELELPADVVIWPIGFSVASNEVADLYAQIDRASKRIVDHLQQAGLEAAEISLSTPVITDKAAQAWGDAHSGAFRYVANRNVTVYSRQVDLVRQAMAGVLDLGREGIVLAADPYQNRVEYLFERLNQIKPEMVEQATRNAREVAQKFAADSGSRLGKIRKAAQGQFSIDDRDSNNPQRKKIRVVSTVEYYLSD